jgi:hypothetical protein
MANLREVVLDFSSVTQNCYPSHTDLVEQLVRQFTKLQRITIKPNYSTKEALELILINGVEVPRPSPSVIEALNRALSVPGRLANATGLNESSKKTPWHGYSFRENKGFLLFRVYRSRLSTRSVIFHDI